MTKRLIAVENVLNSYKECTWLCQQQLARFEKECIERGVGHELYSFFELLDSEYPVTIKRSEKSSLVEVTINADILAMFCFNEAELLDWVDYVCLHTGEVIFEDKRVSKN